MSDNRTVQTLHDKLLGDAVELSFTEAETTALRAMFLTMLEQYNELSAGYKMAQTVNDAFRQGLLRQGFRLCHEEHPDGSVSYNLENAPTTPEETPPTQH